MKFILKTDMYMNMCEVLPIFVPFIIVQSIHFSLHSPVFQLLPLSLIDLYLLFYLMLQNYFFKIMHIVPFNKVFFNTNLIMVC